MIDEPDEAPTVPRPDQSDSELESKLEKAIIGFLTFVGRIFKTLCLVAFRPSRVQATSASPGTSSPYTFLAIGGLLATRSLRVLLLLLALLVSSFDACDKTMDVSPQPPSLTELFSMPAMLEYILIGVPLVGLAIGLAALFSFTLTKESAGPRSGILSAACYSLGFQLFLLGVVLIPYIVILFLDKNMLPVWVVWCSVALVLLWPATVLARFVLTGVSPHQWRIRATALRLPLVIAACVLVSALMISGSCILSFPFHLDDLKTNLDKFPRAIMASQILRSTVQGDVLTITLLAKNQSRGPIIIASQRVVMDEGPKALTGQIIGAEIPLIMAKDQMVAIELSFSPIAVGFDEKATHDLTFETNVGTPVVTAASRAPARPVEPFSWLR